MMVKLLAPLLTKYFNEFMHLSNEFCLGSNVIGYDQIEFLSAPSVLCSISQVGEMSDSAIAVGVVQ